MAKRFVTLFPVVRNVHLSKDLGQIPYHLHASHGYESVVVGYENDKDWPGLKLEAPGLKMQFLKPQGQSLYREKAVLKYLNEEAKRIDVLNLYHLTKETIAYGLRYKRKHPRGKLYVKMDVYNETLEQGVVYSRSWWKQAVHRQLEKRFMKKVDWVSCENPGSLALLRKRYPILTNKSLLIPNGVNDRFVNEYCAKPRPWEYKENLLLSVTRVGAPDKNSPMLLEAFAQANVPGWKLALVGPIEAGFESYLKDYFERYPHLKDHVECPGAIYHRTQLCTWYDRAKVFCLSSPFESFGIAFAEALWYGNYLVGTEGHSSFDLLSNEGKHGQQVPIDQTEALAKCLKQVLSRSHEDGFEARQAWAREQFAWSGIVKRLADTL